MIRINDYSECCGCEACVQICTHNAISMHPDKRGFLYPIVDEKICVDCGLCEDVCHWNKRKSDECSEEQQVYAVKNINKEVLLKSASGGAFSALAQWTFDKGGYVYGVAWDKNMNPCHIRVDCMDGLLPLQGSKYVQSRINEIFISVRNDLNNDKMVLFSGTPCQCAGLRSFLRKKYDKLICVEIICHGVPSAKFFRDYVDVLVKEYKGRIVDFKFRDKKRGWGNFLSISYISNNGELKTKYLSPGESYYYYYYNWGGSLYRPSCYSCRYATEKRESDFTIGDYWGVGKFHPEFKSNDGVSVLIANTAKAKLKVNELLPYMRMIPSEFSFAAEENGQLRFPATYNDKNGFIWEIYEKQGAQGLYDFYKKKNRKNIFIGSLKRKIPLNLKRWLLKLFYGNV